MNLVDSIRDFFTIKARGDNSGTVGKITPTGYEAAGFGAAQGSAKNREYLEEMKSWVGTAVTAISDEVASIKIGLYKMEKGGVKEVDDHEVLDLLYRVNSFTTKFDHFWLTQAFLELTGEAPWFLERKAGKIVNIYFLRPDRIKPVVGKSRMIEGYEYEIEQGKSVGLGMDEVIFLKYPNPAKPFRGIGTLAMAARTVDIDNDSEKWNSSFYANSARPDSILNVKSDSMDSEQKNHLIKSFEKAYKGGANAHKTMLLFGDIEFNKSGFSQKDMDFLEQMRFSRDKILGIFRVPKAIVAQTDSVNYANSKTAEYIFARYTIKPKMERLIQQLNEFLLPQFPGTEGMYFDYDNPVPADEEKQINKYNSALQHGWMTINEVREEQGLEPIDGGDGSNDDTGTDKPKEDKPPRSDPKNDNNDGNGKILKANPERIQSTKIRNKSYFQKQKELVEKKEAVKAVVKDALYAELHKRESFDSKKRIETVTKSDKEKKNREFDSAIDDGWIQRILSKEEIDDYWSLKNKIFNKYKGDFEEGMKKVFKAQRKAVLQKFARKQSSDDLFGDIKLNEEREVQRTLGIMLPTLTDIFREAGDETYQMMQVEAETTVDTPEIRKLIRDNGRAFAVGVTQTTNKYLREQIIQGVSSGASIKEIRDSIVDVFDKAEAFRADRIARTETLRYSTNASEQAFVDSGIVEGKMWVTDPDPCPYCSTFAGRTAKLGENFANKGDVINDRVFDYDDLPSPPLHPNCRCDIIPVFKAVKANIDQVNKGLDQVYNIAPSAKKEIDFIARKTARKELGRKVAVAPLKGRERALEKVLNDYDGDWNKITDIARNTIVVSSSKDYHSLIKSFAEEYKDRIISYKIVDASKDAMGYSGVNIKIRPVNRIAKDAAAEMQINTSWMIYAKEKKADALRILGEETYNKIEKRVGVPGGRGHELYEQYRVSKDVKQRVRLENESKDYYNSIREKIGDGID